MGRKAQISIVTLVFAAIVTVLLAYWWDSTHKDVIAEGVTIGGVDVGGLDSDAAATQVRSNLVAPLERTLKVKYGGESFELTAKELNVHANVKAMVADALAASQAGGLPSRVWRGVSGGELDKSIRPELAYDKGKSSISSPTSPPTSAATRSTPASAPSGGKLVPVASKSGLKVDESRLRKDVDAALLDPATRTLRARVEKVKPDVTTAQVAEKYPTYIVVDRSNYTLSLYRNLKLEKQYTVAIGAIGYDTQSAFTTSRTSRLTPSGTSPTPPGPGTWPADRSRRAREPAQGPLDGDLRWRRNPRDLRHRVTRQRRLPRLHPHGRPRCRGPVRPGGRRHPHLHLLILTAWEMSARRPRSAHVLAHGAPTSSLT